MPDKDKPVTLEAPVTAQEAVELKPCPFCGKLARARECKDVEFLVHNADCYMVQCDGCGCGTSYELNEAEAISVWNRRTQEAPHA